MTPQCKTALVEDMAFLRKFHFFHLRDWHEDAPVAEVHRGSLMLRHWLADRELARVWQAAGFPGEPRIAAIDLAAVVAARGAGVPDFALAGAAPANSPSFRLYALSEYLESPSVFLRGTAIARREIIRYMAHLGEPSPRKQDRDMAKRLGRLEAKANAYRKDAFLLEAISIGQTVTQTPDVEKLLRAC